MNLPADTGFYLWYITDLNYADVGLVQILADTPQHQKHCRDNPRPTFYMYGVGPWGRVLTMYHQAHDHLPPMDLHNTPLVDGWIPFDFRTVGLIREPVEKIELKRIPRRPESI